MKRKVISYLQSGDDFISIFDIYKS